MRIDMTTNLKTGAIKAAQTFLQAWKAGEIPKKDPRALTDIFHQYGVMVQEFVRERAQPKAPPPTPEEQKLRGEIREFVEDQWRKVPGARGKKQDQQGEKQQREPLIKPEKPAPRDDRWWVLTFPNKSVAYLQEVWPNGARMFHADSKLPETIVKFIEIKTDLQPVWTYTPPHLTVVPA
jgi:hypothetical protein